MQPSWSAELWGFTTFNPEDPADPMGGGQVMQGPTLGSDGTIYVVTVGTSEHETNALYALSPDGATLYLAAAWGPKMNDWDVAVPGAIHAFDATAGPATAMRDLGDHAELAWDAYVDRDLDRDRDRAAMANALALREENGQTTRVYAGSGTVPNLLTLSYPEGDPAGTPGQDPDSRGTIPTTRDSDRPKTSGSYISSTITGPAWNSPGVRVRTR